MQIRQRESVSFPVESVVAALGDPNFHMRRIQRDPNTVSVRSEPGSDRIVVHVLQKRRTATGGVDPVQTDPATQIFHWETPRSLAWSWKQGGIFAITITGRFRVEPERSGSVVESETEVNIPIPLVGRVLEKVVASELGKANASLRADLEQAIRARASSS